MLYNDQLIDNIRDILIEKKLSLAVAESVTAGHLQAAFSSALQASEFFQGGITAYNVGQKCRHLNIDPILGLETDCVAEVVARQMSVQVNQLFISNYGIAITGYASKMPEKGIENLFAYFSIAFGNEVLLCEKIETSKERVEAQVDYTNQVIAAFNKLLTNNNAAG